MNPHFVLGGALASHITLVILRQTHILYIQTAFRIDNVFMPHPSTIKPATACKPSATSLEQLLRRPDVWRGHSRNFLPSTVIDTGYAELNQALQHKGWPSGGLIEVCQSYHAAEWQLFHPGISLLMAEQRMAHLALINPPALPFVAALQQMNINSQQVIVVQTHTTEELIVCFKELSRSLACPLVFAWQPKRALSYAQLRKLQLSTTEQHGLYVIFRHLRAAQQSSPACLRLTLSPRPRHIELHIFKQKGQLQSHTITLPIPEVWKPLAAHNVLNRAPSNEEYVPYGASQRSKIALFHALDSRSLNSVPPYEHR